MTYSTWRADNLSLIEKYTGFEVLEGFSNTKVVAEEARVEGLPHRLSKKNLKWLQKVRDLHKKKTRIVISEVTSLAQEGCDSLMTDMFEEDTKLDTPAKSSSVPRRQSFECLEPQSVQDQDTDYDSDTEDEDDDYMTDTDSLSEMFEDTEFMKFLGMNRQDFPKRKINEGDVLGMMNCAMSTVFNSPLIKRSVDQIMTQSQLILERMDLSPQDKEKVKLQMQQGQAVLDAMMSGSSQDSLMNLYQRMSKTSEDPSLQALTQSSQDTTTLDLNDFGKLSQSGSCSLM